MTVFCRTGLNLSELNLIKVPKKLFACFCCLPFLSKIACSLISFSFHVSDLNAVILDHIAYSQLTSSDVVSASIIKVVGALTNSFTDLIWPRNPFWTFPKFNILTHCSCATTAQQQVRAFKPLWPHYWYVIDWIYLFELMALRCPSVADCIFAFSPISKMTKDFLPFWAFPVANKPTSVPFSPNLKIMKPYGDRNLEHDLQINSRHLSGKTASSEFCFGHWTQHKCRNVVVVVNDDDNNNSKQMLARGLEPCSGSI